ncbi:mannose-6-phosphate isomerase [Saccharopolyspora erythraea NRRL 2338]|uniref:Mannose-6-phosphate isomerase, class I n=2 Tax=Saccharopolyspora erythraea TaxID=1836 RepID=A4FMX5_SACEN|nr:class I mannose-6-phosphate isomerase [Saccharopolyspora erythraea]EQD84926.1 mannose-6-phosphate isomerase [Saccharopolyspora erythraea D]PFG99044.1 mannose-6-phosphate isomerase [Saccharopolyspora erythraea NRRL 2338]QRK89007.1 class I mannose-6-phosphate isomerase [Saccharopolyspora erythraea]CAM05400.1 mannose-6-phosphate isomerase, class I [Saccharopolyspora erythraea NRRL 2338]
MTSAHTDQHPVVLPANQPEQFYRGGASIAALRGAGDDRDFGPEDWVASTTTRFGQPEAGLSRLPDGRLLRDAVAAAPESWLGADHVGDFGDSTALLVKLLDAGQRLPVHCHPSDGFARQHLGSRFGKTEAWIVVGTTGPNPVVYLGFREDVAPETVAHWVATQDSSAMLGSLNEIPVKPGDTVHVPAGTPHAIGAGVFIVELQQPTDFSITLEWQGFLADAEGAFLGMDHETALRTVNRAGFGDATLASLIKHTAGQDDPRVPLLAEDAAEFFLADRLHPRGGLELDPSFGVLIVLDGAGTLRAGSGSATELRRGHTVVVPHSAGTAVLEGELTAVHCRPPAPRGTR